MGSGEVTDQQKQVEIREKFKQPLGVIKPQSEGFSEMGQQAFVHGELCDEQSPLQPNLLPLEGLNTDSQTPNELFSQQISGQNFDVQQHLTSVISKPSLQVQVQALAKRIGVNYLKGGPDPKSLSRSSLEMADGAGHPFKPADFSTIVTEHRGWTQKPAIHIGCSPSNMHRIEKMIADLELEPSQVFLTTKPTLNHCQFQARSAFHLENAEVGLRSSMPHFSAAMVFTSLQKLLLILMPLIFVAGIYYHPAMAFLAIHILATVFYFAVTLMRMAIVVPGVDHLMETDAIATARPCDAAPLPTYTVMVALYKEAGQVPTLGQSLAAIDWPKDRIQVLLVCEQDDPDTIAACRELETDERFRTIVCPPGKPKTKPKALDYALPLAIGEFLVLYDAEDRPHPRQLREAFAKFSIEQNMACLQAPLAIHNCDQSWFSQLFAIEYRTLFCAILPALEKWGSPIPLGGTSNHFRTAVLRSVGAWDPHNVTEDADLGIRLARYGHACGTLTLPTLEEAPPYLTDWFKQRTRWVKGWVQTLLVHMRNPIRLGRELGFRECLFFHLVLTSMVVSFLIHPFFLVSLGFTVFTLVTSSDTPPIFLALLGIDLFNLVCGYATYFALAWFSIGNRRLRHLRKKIIWFPVYWLLISFAGWRGIWQLFTRPFHWEKTRHGLSNTALNKNL